MYSHIPAQTPANDVDVLVLNTGARETTGCGRAIRLLPGVSAVTAYPERGQVLVRYDGSAAAACLIMETLHPAQPQTVAVAWLIKLPKLARALSVATSLL
jgi:hypothetical protein